MLSVFPELLNYDLVGITLIRILAGLVVLYIGLITISTKRPLYTSEMHLKNHPFAEFWPWVFGIIEVLTGLFLLVGFLTQIMAIIAGYLFINLGFIEKNIGKVLNQSTLFFFVMTLVSISILFIGPGLFSIDLPL